MISNPSLTGSGDELMYIIRYAFFSDGSSGIETGCIVDKSSRKCWERAIAFAQKYVVDQEYFETNIIYAS